MVNMWYFWVIQREKIDNTCKNNVKNHTLLVQNECFYIETSWKSCII